jgi:hypothetical protein
MADRKKRIPQVLPLFLSAAVVIVQPREDVLGDVQAVIAVEDFPTANLDE